MAKKTTKKAVKDLEAKKSVKGGFEPVTMLKNGFEPVTMLKAKVQRGRK